MLKIMWIAAAAVASMLAVSCSRDIQNSEAIKQGVLNYLNERKAQIGLDPGQLQIDIASVSFQKNEAHANVMFRPKNVADPTPMTIAYLLDRKGDKWVVRPHSESGANPHGAGETAIPPDHPPVGEEAPLPPGHPAIPPHSGSKQ